jgi:hypothetical protein
VTCDSESKATELSAGHSDGEPVPLNEHPESDALQPDHYRSPSSSDDYTTADIRTLMHRLYALASQI